MIYSSFFFLIILSHHLLSVNTSWKKINNKIILISGESEGKQVEELLKEIKALKSYGSG